MICMLFVFAVQPAEYVFGVGWSMKPYEAQVRVRKSCASGLPVRTSGMATQPVYMPSIVPSVVEHFAPAETTLTVVVEPKGT